MLLALMHPPRNRQHQQVDLMLNVCDSAKELLINIEEMKLPSLMPTLLSIKTCLVHRLSSQGPTVFQSRSDFIS